MWRQCDVSHPSTDKWYHNNATIKGKLHLSGEMIMLQLCFVLIASDSW